MVAIGAGPNKKCVTRAAYLAIVVTALAHHTDTLGIHLSSVPPPLLELVRRTDHAQHGF